MQSKKNGGSQEFQYREWEEKRLEAKSLFREGDFFEDFQILKRVGSGAFATVFLARQSTMHRLVAIKVSADTGDEPKTLAQLDHQGIVRVFDVRRLADQKVRLLVMQYVAGGTLADVIHCAQRESFDERSGQIVLHAIDSALLGAAMPAPEECPRREWLAQSSWSETVCEIGIQLAESLEFAHRQKILHRDLKPANVLLTAEGKCKLADFNVSSEEGFEETNADGILGGSLVYMSPEQLRAAAGITDHTDSPLDARSDIYSLACVLWELLTAERPWPNDPIKMDRIEMLKEMLRRRHEERPFLDPNLARDEKARKLMLCLRQALSFDRESRTPSAPALAGQLRLCTSPEAWSVLHPESVHWANRACRYPTLVSLIAIFVPNGLAGAFNYHYNLAWLTARHPDGHKDLIEVSILMNCLSFGMGGLFFLLVVWPVTREIGRRCRSHRSDNSRYMQRTMLIGHTAAVFGLGLWLVAGTVFPILLSIRLPEFGPQDAIHFFLSLAICGAIAVSYPFLGMSLLAAKVWYGVLIGNHLQDKDYLDRSSALMVWCDRYLLAATAVPLAGLAMLLSQSAPVRPALMILVAASALGLFLAFRVRQRIQHTVNCVAPIVDPSRT
jgi:eukaryotic-like serine/threonine-protein kinase